MGQITRHGLFVDVRGDTGSPPLLFLHGGPGQGCRDFMAMQGGFQGNTDWCFWQWPGRSDTQPFGQRRRAAQVGGEVCAYPP